MEDSREMQKLHGFLQCSIYVMVALEAAIFVYLKAPVWGFFYAILFRISHIPIYQSILFSKLTILMLICLVSIGTLSKKSIDLNPKKQIILPMCMGLLLFFGSICFYNKPSLLAFKYTSWNNVAYMTCSLIGAIMLSLSMDNISKIIRSGLGKDNWNVEGESFMQQTKRIDTPSSVNIPMLFYFKGKVRKGWINLNIYRSILNIGVPGSGKTFSLINPAIRQLISKEFCLCIFDYKYPDQGKIAYYHYLLAKQQGKCEDFSFHVVNLDHVERSRRINPWRSDYIGSLAGASETAEGLVQALKKGDNSGGSDQFFTQSAINFLATCIYFFSKYAKGKYSSFPHVSSFLNCSYQEIFGTLFSDPELASLLSPFQSAFKEKAFDQLEGQVGTLKIFISRLVTKETFWIFSGDDFDLKISNPKEPSILVLANDPNTQNINSACYSLVLNRLTKLINSKGNRPSALVVDEIPTIYINQLSNFLAVCRSNRTGVILGLQELTVFEQQYGKDASATITSIVGNVITGAVRHKTTLEWLELLFGEVKQLGQSITLDRSKTSIGMNEKLDALIPAGKIASLRSGEMVGIIADDAAEKYTGKYVSPVINCRINLDMEAIQKEENSYHELPVYYDFKGEKEEILLENFKRINQEVKEIIVEVALAAVPQLVSREKATMASNQKQST